MNYNGGVSSEQIAHDLAVASAIATVVNHITNGQYGEPTIRQLIDAAYSRAIQDFHSRYPGEASE